MCKLFGITSTTTITRRQTDAITRAVHRSFRITQRDGFGFTLANPDRTRYTERYTQPGQFAGIGAASAAKKRLPDALKPAVKMDAHGTRHTAGCTSLIIHGRTSTNDITIANTQPLNKAGWTLAHNGVVEWTGKNYPLETTNDSEHLLNLFALGDWQKELGDVRGYAALLLLDTAGNFLAFKDSRAPLHFAQVKNGFIVATSPDDILAACRAAKIKKPYITSVPDNVLVAFAPDGTVTSQPHAGIQSAYSLTAAAATAFGSHHYYSPNKPTTATPTRATYEEQWNGVKPKTRGKASKQDVLPLDAMTEAEWNAHAPASIHGMSDEELQRYGLA